MKWWHKIKPSSGVHFSKIQIGRKLSICYIFKIKFWEKLYLTETSKILNKSVAPSAIQGKKEWQAFKNMKTSHFFENTKPNFRNEKWNIIVTSLYRYYASSVSFKTQKTGIRKPISHGTEILSHNHRSQSIYSSCVLSVIPLW